MALTDPGGGNRRVIYYDLPFPVTLAGTVYSGDMVGYSAGFKQADDDGAIPALYVACENGVSGDKINVARRALLDGYTLGTVDGLVYLSNTAGETTETVTQQVVGRILTASLIWVDLLPVVVGKFEIAAKALASGDYGFKSVVYQDAGQSEGIAGYFEGHMTGTPTGVSYALGAWLNVDEAPSGANEVRIADFGMYGVGVDMTGVNVVGLNIGLHFSAANPPTQIVPIRFNATVPGATADGIFRATGPEAIGYATGAAETATKVGDIPFLITGTTYYIRVYDGVS